MSNTQIAETALTDMNSESRQAPQGFELVFFERKPAYRNFSLELHFKSVKENLPPEVQYRSCQSRFPNQGAFSKFYNLFEPIFKKKGEVNHITGDVHYIGIFMPRKNTLLTVHDVNLMYSKKGLKKWFLKWFWLKLPVKRARMISVVSQCTKDELLKYVDCDPDKIRVVHSPIPPHFYPSPKKFNKEKPVVLQIGIKSNKNLERVVEAIKGIHCRLEIIGKPPENILEKLDRYGIDYHWSEFLTDEQVTEKYIESDLLIFASTVEGFGIPIVEAQMVGRPVVCSNLMSMPEVAGDSACLVNPYDVDDIRRGILEVINNESYRNDLIRKGNENCQRFTGDNIARNYVKLYREILSMQ